MHAISGGGGGFWQKRKGGMTSTMWRVLDKYRVTVLFNAKTILLQYMYYFHGTWHGIGKSLNKKITNIQIGQCTNAYFPKFSLKTLVISTHNSSKTQEKKHDKRVEKARSKHTCNKFLMDPYWTWLYFYLHIKYIVILKIYMYSSDLKEDTYFRNKKKT